MPAMADWRQIQARIRKAKNSADAKTKLSELYQRTHDAMVAWELAAVEEKAERNDEAVKWYTIAAERFRRADWKKKAEEALTRLGAPLPVPGAKLSPEPQFTASGAAKSETVDSGTETTSAAGFHESAQELADSQPDSGGGETAGEPDDQATEAQPTSSPLSKTRADGESQDSSDSTEKKKRRRGRRGGRGRRRKGAPAPALPSKYFASSGSSTASQASSASQSPMPGAANRREQPREESTRKGLGSAATASSRGAEPLDEPGVRSERPAPMLPSERTAHGRAGDPALASRMSKLESMLRRLVSSPLHRLDEADAAPAGPGVFLLSDSDQITSYYVEACQTLRVGLGNLARGSGRSSTKQSRGGRPAFDSGLKTKLAEHLGIGEAKVSQYLNEHCVVRWIQLDDDAPHLAHFAIGVLRTPLNLD
jgi:hypothetical protein